MNRFALRLIVVFAILASAVSADPVGWQESFALPLSPGTVAILVEHGDMPEVQQRWREGLRHEDRDVRAATARALYASGSRALAPALAARLAVEDDETAAIEQIRALVSLAGPDGDVAVLAAGQRLSGDGRVAAWMQLGRARGLEALKYLPTLRASDGPEESRRSLVRAAIRGGREGMDQAIALALDQNDSAAWYVLWQATISAGGLISDGQIGRSLHSSNPRIRAISYWNMAMLVHAGNPVPKSLVQPLEATAEARGETKDATDWPSREARFAFDLLQRARGKKAHEDLEWARAIPPGVSPWPFPGLSMQVAGLLTKNERAALVKSEHYPKNIDDVARLYRWWPERRHFAEERPPGTRTLALAEFPKGYVHGLAELTECHEPLIRADLTYTPEGRPMSATLRHADRLSEACAATGRILFRSHPYRLYTRWSEAKGTRLEPGDETIALAFLDAASLAWHARHSDERVSAADRAAAGLPLRVGDEIKRPRKRKIVAPEFPKAAVKRGIDGMVTMEALVDTEGRVAEVQVIQGFEELNAAAVTALRNSVYEPTIVNGTAVPVIVRVWACPGCEERADGTLVQLGPPTFAGR